MVETRLDGVWNGRVFVVIGIGLHVPDDLVGEHLGKLGSLEDVALYVSEGVVAEGLNDLRYVEECDVDIVALQSAHGVLGDERVVAILW